MKVLRPLRHRDFALLWSGMTVSMLGDGIYTVAIAWQVYALSNTPTALAFVGIAWTVPSLLSVLFGGVASDRLDRRTVMIASDLIRMVVIGAIGALSWTGALELWHLYGLVAVFGVASAFFGPSFMAIVPDILPQEQLVEANSLAQVVRPLAFFMVGPALGGWAVASLGAGPAFLLDAGSFVVSALAIFAMRIRRAPSAPEAERTSPLADIREGLAFVRSTSWLWASMLTGSLGVLAFFGPLEVLLPYIVKNELDAGADTLGLIFAAGGLGSLLAGLAMAQIGLPRRAITFMWVTWGIGLAGVAGYGLAQEPWQAMLTGFVVSALFSVGYVVWVTLLQSQVPAELRGRVSSLDWMIGIGLVPLSFAITGPVAAAVGARETMIGASLFGCAVTFICFFAIPNLREPERESHDVALPADEA